jgi:hypothetical protein
MKIQTTLALTIFAVALFSAPATADEQGGSQACLQYAFSMCGQFIPDRERVAACLISNRSRVSPACRSALSHFKTASSES